MRTRMFNIVFLLSVGLFLSLPSGASGAIGLSGGQFQIIKGDSVIAEFNNLKDAAWAAPLLNADTVSMVTMRPDITDVVFEVWKDGQVIETFSTRAEAQTYAQNNGGDSITMPPQTVTPIGE